MKRVYIIGIVGAALVSLMGAAIVLALLVTPVRAQIARTIDMAINNRASQLFQGQSPQMKGEKGVLVAGVFTGSPADTAGLVRGDILLQVDGQDINTRQDLNGILAKHKAGDALKILVQHGDAQKTVIVTLAEPPTAPSTTQNGQQPQPTQKNPFLGIVPIGAGEYRGRFGKFGPGMGQFRAGAVIVQVASGSPAEKAGLKVGEVITSVNGTAIDAQNSLSTLLGKQKPGDAVKLQVTGSDGTSREVNVTLGDNPQKAGTAYLGVSVGGGRFRGGMPFRNLVPGLMGHPGALVQNVTAGSPAEKAGLKQGQLIQAVDGKTISGPSALTDAISAHKPGDTVTLTVFDAQSSKSNDVKITLGDNPQKAGTAWMGITYTYIDMQPNPSTNPTSGSNF